MKKIITDSLWAHMLFFTTIVTTGLSLTKFNPFIFVLTGCVYFLLIIRSAMIIADFEMSAQGEIIKHMDEHRGKIDSVIINRRK